SIADEEPASRIVRERMRLIEFVFAAAFLAERSDQLARLVEPDEPRVVAAMAFRHDDVAVRRDDDVVRGEEEVGFFAAARLSDRHQQLAVAIEFENLMAFRLRR